MTNPSRLEILTDLRKEAGLSLSQMARRCGLRGRQSHQTAGAWERGVYVPNANRRTPFIGYLWDDLGLRRDPARFEEVWSVLVEEWAWAPISDAEWRQHFPAVARPSAAPAEDAHGGEPESKRELPPPFQAPAPVPHFVGRRAEAQALAARLAPLDAPGENGVTNGTHGAPAAGSPRVVALVGMGGVGKTTLATCVAHHLRARFPDGVLWGFAATGNPLDILQSWARAYGYDFSGLSDLENRAAAVRNLLAARHALLVLDDVTSVARARPLLPGSVTCPVLLTTRNEEVAIGLGAEVISLTELTPAAGMELLTHILGAPRVERERPAAQSICEALHQLPLAVELAAQFLAARPRRPLAQMAARLRSVHHRLDLQVSDRAVRTSFVVSWDGLDPAHRALFARLAVFGGRSFTAEAAAHVAELDLFTAQDRLEMLKALSLLREEGTTRYQQHPLLADFAREQLGDGVEPLERLARYYLAFSQEHNNDYATLEPEWDGIMAGMEAAHGLEAWKTVLEYADALTEPWFTRAEYSRARQGYEWAVEAAQAQADDRALARSLRQWGQVLLEQDWQQAAEAQLHNAMILYKQMDDPEGMAAVLYLLARLALERAEHYEADQYLKTASQLRQYTSDSRGLAKVWYQQGLLAYRTGDLEGAEQFCQQAYQVQQSDEDPTELVTTLRLFIDIAVEQKQYDKAEQYCQTAISLCETLENRAQTACVHYSTAVVYRFGGRPRDALAHSENAQRMFEQMMDRSFLAVTLFEQSKAYAACQEYELARIKADESLALFRQLNQNSNAVYALYQLGKICAQMSQAEQAQRYWREGLQIARSSNHSLVARLEEHLTSHQAALPVPM